MNNFTFIVASFLFSALITFMIMPKGIELLQHLKLGKKIREEGLIGKAIEFAKLHEAKIGTPTMGGVFILFTVIFTTIISIIVHFLSKKYDLDILNNTLWNRKETYLPMFTLISVGFIGIIDDYLNVREIGRTKGLPARVKMILLILFAVVAAYWFYEMLGRKTIHIPLMGDLLVNYWYIPISVLVFISTANSVNITDGLDGLAGGLLLFNFSVFAYIAYDRGLFILSAFCMIIAGSLIGFLWFNIKPARLYMGDTGALSLGATLAIMALMTDTIFVLLITGSIFIFETLSVIIQITSKKLRNGKKIFRIAPFHHHLEAIGWKEETVVMRFWLIGMIVSAIGLIIGAISK